MYQAILYKAGSMVLSTLTIKAETQEELDEQVAQALKQGWSKEAGFYGKYLKNYS